MIPVFRICDCIFANSTVCITTFMVSYEVWMNPLIALFTFITVVIFLRSQLESSPSCLYQVRCECSAMACPCLLICTLCPLPAPTDFDLKLRLPRGAYVLPDA